MRIRHRGRALIAAAAALVVGLGVAAVAFTTTAAADVIDATYASDPGAIANPDRGFYHRVEIVGLSDSDVTWARNQGITLLHSYVHLDNFRSSPISADLLTRLTAGLAKARNGGMKVILRVAYNMGPYPNSQPDASETWINQHLAQLQPVLAANADVISSFEAGLIGAWGEWHTSTNGYDRDVAAKTRILKATLAAFPADRQVALRYPADVRAQLPRLTAAEGARIGNHQDCFGASEPDDWGTWGRDGSSVAADKQLIATIGQGHVIGGETCNADSPRANCATALSELASMHFSNLNIDYHRDVIARYRSEGCFETIRRNLGYRLRLVSARYPAQLSPGGPLALRVVVRNDGWAAPFNARPVFAVLDGPSGRYSIPIDADVRHWAPGAETTIDSTLTVPATVPAGTYRLALWLPDQYESLRTNPAYSIRLANTGTWDGAAGFNVLATNVTVSNTGPGQPSTTTPAPTSSGPSGSPSGSASYEAEAPTNTLTGQARIAACAGCSGGSKVGYLGNGGALAFTGIAGGDGGTRRVEIHYTSAETRSAVLHVGSADLTVSFPPTGGWSTVGVVAVDLTLAAGPNTVTVDNPNGWAPDIDRLVVPGAVGASPTQSRSSSTSPPPPTPSTAPPSATGTQSGLIVDNFDGTPAWPSTHRNDLGRWTGANGFRNGQGAGAVTDGALVLRYDHDGWFGTDVKTSVSAYRYLVIRIRGAAGGEQAHFQLTVGGRTAVFNQFVDDTGASPRITRSYQNIRIPLQANGINTTAPDQISFGFWHGAAVGTVYIDQISFEN